MRLVDTSLWIELFARGKLLEEAKQSILPLNTCIVPAMVHYELAKWSGRYLSPADSQDILSLLTDCQTASMDVAVAVEAAMLSAKHKLHAIDAVIYATAQLAGATLYTCDAHFSDLPGVEYFEKESERVGLLDRPTL
jgi:predicted nucleic acid-binding protein